MGSEFLSLLRAFVGMVGLILIIIGASILIYLIYYVVQVIEGPNNVPIVEYFLEKVKINDNAFRGSVTSNDMQGKTLEFDIKWSESVRLVIFSFILIGVFSVVGRLCHICITSGSALIKTVFEHKDKKNKKQSNKV